MGRLIDADDAVRRSREPSIYDLTDVPDFLAECPTVDAEPVRHGRWEECFEDWRNQIAGNKCSLCGFEYFGNNMKYCPECGAKMDGGTQ